MPWEARSMSETRAAFVALVRSGCTPVARACRSFGISRKTGYKWLARARQQPGQPLADRARRPLHAPARTGDALEQAILEVRDRHGWGARKIHAYLAGGGLRVPSARTLTAVLRRHGRIAPADPTPGEPPQRFERGAANELWQLDFKGPLAFGRRKLHLFDVLDDH